MLFFLMAVSGIAKEKILKNQDFEDQIPGNIPSGWKKAWGNQGEDLFLVSSEYAVSGTQSMLFDRLTGDNKDQWGLSANFPNIKKGMYKLSFNIMVIGPGNNASFSFEIRDRRGKQRLFKIAFKDRKIILGSYAHLPREKKSSHPTKYDPKEWYNLTATFPASKEDGNEVNLTITQLSNPSNTKTVKNIMTFSKVDFGMIMLCVAPRKNGYRVFIDDFKVLATTNKKEGAIVGKNKLKTLATGLLAATTLYANAAGVDQKLKSFMAKSKTQRVAVIAMGDSNQHFGGHGWGKYMCQAILKKFGSYGTGLVQVVRRVPTWAKAKGLRSTEAPKELGKDLFTYWYLPKGEQQKSNWNVTGFGITKDDPMDIRGSLKYRIKYATFADGKGSFQPAVRLNKAPWKTFFKADKISTSGEKTEMKEFSMTLKADPKRDFPIMFLASPVNAMIEGPFLGEFFSIENLDKKTGCSYSTLYGVGGKSLSDMLTFLNDKGEATLTSYFKFVRESLNNDKSCMIMINSGLNDRNRKSTSIGPEKNALSNTKEGYKDNLKGIMMLLEKCWIKAGGKKETIHFALMPSHPVSTPDDKKLVSYREVALELAKEKQNASCILLPKIVSQETMKKDGHYDKHGNAHLTKKGYEEISKQVAEAMAK